MILAKCSVNYTNFLSCFTAHCCVCSCNFLFHTSWAYDQTEEEIVQCGNDKHGHSINKVDFQCFYVSKPKLGVVINFESCVFKQKRSLSLGASQNDLPRLQFENNASALTFQCAFNKNTYRVHSIRIPFRCFYVSKPMLGLVITFESCVFKQKRSLSLGASQNDLPRLQFENNASALTFQCAFNKNTLPMFLCLQTKVRAHYNF